MDEELLDTFDENNEATGISRMRKHVHADGDWHRTAHIYVINKDGQYLVHLRSSHKDHSPDCWSARFGGHVISGMSYEQGAVNELREEIGLDISPDDLIEGFVYRYENGLNREHPKVFFYRYDGDLKTLSFTDDEVVKVRWLTAEAIERGMIEDPNSWSGKPERLCEVDALRKKLCN